MQILLILCISLFNLLQITRGERRQGFFPHQPAIKNPDFYPPVFPPSGNYYPGLGFDGDSYWGGYRGGRALGFGYNSGFSGPPFSSGSSSLGVNINFFRRNDDDLKQSQSKPTLYQEETNLIRRKRIPQAIKNPDHTFPQRRPQQFERFKNGGAIKVSGFMDQFIRRRNQHQPAFKVPDQHPNFNTESQPAIKVSDFAHAPAIKNAEFFKLVK